MRLCFTGHRPQHLNGFKMSDNAEMLRALKSVIIDYIENKNVDTFISGMALGVDIWSAFIVLKLKETYPHIKLVCAIPHANQYAVWKNEDDIEDWKYIVERADTVHYVSDEPFTPWCLQKRNEWMVDNADYVLAVWNGNKYKCGTYNCIKYAKRKQSNILRLNPNTLELSEVA